MRKVMMTVVGLVGLSLLLCGADEVLAQGDTALDPRVAEDRDATDSRVQGTPGGARVGSPSSPGTSAPETAAGGAGASSAAQEQSLLQLQGEVARLRQEVAQLRAELTDMTASMGVGGSGQAGVAPSAVQPGPAADQDTTQGGTESSGAVAGGTTGQGAAPRGSAAQGTAPRGTEAGGSEVPGAAVVDAIYTGTVSSVSARRLVLVDDAEQSFTVELGDRTRMLRNGQRISVEQLEPGTRVRVTVDMLSGHNQATEITTLPAR